MRILLLQMHPFDISKNSINASFEPIGLCYLSAYLKQNGYPDVKILQEENYSEQGKFIEDIVNYQPDIIGFTSFACVFNKARKLANYIKKELPNVTTIWGGSHPSTYTDILHCPEVDYIVVGEAEYTIVELLEYIEKGNPDLSRIKGIAYLDGETITVNQRRERIANLDSLPFPDRSDLPINYFDISAETYGLKRALVISSRGCTSNCKFCTAPFVSSRKQFFRSSANIVEEIEILKRDFNVEYIYFGDEDLLTDKDRAKEFMREIIQRKLNIHFMFGGKVAQLDDELIVLLKKAGCSRIHFGIEHHSTKRRKDLHKHLSQEKIFKSIEAVRKSGIFIQASIIIGFPGETRSSLEECRKFIRKLNVDYLLLYILSPFHKTKIRQELEENNIPFEKNEDLYDYYNPIITLPDVTAEELKAWRSETLRKFYFSFQYIRIVLYRLFQSPKIFKNYVILIFLAFRRKMFIK